MTPGTRHIDSGVMDGVWTEDMNMNTKQILNDYMRVVHDFAQKLADIDEKHGTYLRLEIVDNVARVDHIGQSICTTKRSRAVYVREMVLNGTPS